MKKTKVTEERLDERTVTTVPHSTTGTNRPEAPSLEGREPLPEELTGRASGTDDSLVALFDNGSAEHLTDGFRGGSEDIPGDEAVDGDGVDTRRESTDDLEE